RCGLGAVLYLGAAGMVVLTGLWGAVSSWRRHAAGAHVLSIGVIIAGLVLVAPEAAPRIGHANVDPTCVWGRNTVTRRRGRAPRGAPAPSARGAHLLAPGPIGARGTGPPQGTWHRALGTCKETWPRPTGTSSAASGSNPRPAAPSRTGTPPTPRT